MKIVVGLASTKLYLHAFKSCIRRIVATIRHEKGTMLYVSDDSPECAEAAKRLRSELTPEWTLEHIPLAGLVSSERYKVPNQIVIARLQGELFARARALDADLFMNVEADVLIPSDAFRVMRWALTMPDHDGAPYYDIAMCTYPNGLFLGGHGDYQRPIAEDFMMHERQVPIQIENKHKRLVEQQKSWHEAKKVVTPKESEKMNEEMGKVLEAVRKCPPKGNIWKLNAEFGWRRRGWLDFAYPGIGKGAIVPVDWIGTGCCMLTKRALSMSDFDGYDGRGTQDLFLCWKRWNPAHLRMTAITHTVCDHVKHEVIDGKETGKYIHFQAFHETSGEGIGHLRCVQKPWVDI